MTVESEVLEQARKLRTDAVSQVLQSEATSVYRIAYALSGPWDVGRGIARFVLNRSVKMMPKWKPDDDPDNWYHRFTIMVSRRSAHHQPAAGQDVLIEQALQPTPEYVAFVAAVRNLDTQQREAFLLRHGEKLNARYTALAMDCSTQAAENHLRAAEQSLQVIAAANYQPLIKQLIDAYLHLTPEEDQLLPTVNNVVFRQVRLRKLLRRIITLLGLASLAAMIWGGWKLYHFART